MSKAELNERSFYESIVGGYDRMTSFEHRLESAREFAAELTRQEKIDTAVDMACGTGLYAIALAEKGVNVTGVDVAPGMIKAARTNAARYGVADKLSWLVRGMQQAPSESLCAKDAVTCMANSIPHVLDREEFSKTLANFNHMLRPGGVVVIQLLNYHRVLTQRERIVSIDRKRDEEFIRFYDFLPDGTLRFNLLRVDWQSAPNSEPAHELKSVRLRPYRWDEISQALEARGFTSIRQYGSPLFSDFNADESLTVMITARKAGG